MQLEISVLSKPGGREPNEDAFGFWSSSGALFAVMSDGAGGHGGGDVASKLAVRTALARFQAEPKTDAPTVEAALGSAHEAILAQQGCEKRLAAMRATIAMLALDAARHTATWAHLGDTRLYCFRGRRIVAQTKDHSVVQRMVDAGYLEPDALRVSDHRNRLFAALGEAGTMPPPDAADFGVVAGDVFLLCTDGWWEHVDERGMETALDEAASAEDWLRRMESAVVAHGGEGQDNYSALAVWCTQPADDATDRAIAAAGA